MFRPPHRAVRWVLPAGGVLAVLAAVGLFLIGTPQATPLQPSTALPPLSTEPSADAGVTYGWELTAGNTGLAGTGTDRQSLPVFDGTITPGMTVSRVKITRPLDLTNVADVTLDRVWLQPTSGPKALILGPGTVIRNSNIDGSRMPGGERWGLFHADRSGGGYTIEGVQVTGVSIGAWLDGSAPGVMTATYIHGLVSTRKAHIDGITRRAGTGALTITRSRVTVDFGSWATGAFFLQNTGGDPIGGILLRDSLLEGEGYVMTLQNTGAGTALNAHNVRLRSTGYGPVTTVGTITYDGWTNVSVYDPGRRDGAGAAVPSQ